MISQASKWNSLTYARDFCPRLYYTKKTNSYQHEHNTSVCDTRCSTTHNSAQRYVPTHAHAGYFSNIFVHLYIHNLLHFTMRICWQTTRQPRTLTTVGSNAVSLVRALPSHSPLRQPLLQTLAKGLSQPEASNAFNISRSTYYRSMEDHNSFEQTLLNLHYVRNE